MAHISIWARIRIQECLASKPIIKLLDCTIPHLRLWQVWSKPVCSIKIQKIHRNQNVVLTTNKYKNKHLCQHRPVIRRLFTGIFLILTSLNGEGLNLVLAVWQQMLIPHKMFLGLRMVSQKVSRDNFLLFSFVSLLHFYHCYFNKWQAQGFMKWRNRESKIEFSWGFQVTEENGCIVSFELPHWMLVCSHFHAAVWVHSSRYVLNSDCFYIVKPGYCMHKIT